MNYNKGTQIYELHVVIPIDLLVKKYIMNRCIFKLN